MPINLSKGQKVDLTKGNPGLKNIMVGLGWDVNAFDSGADFDLDAAAFMHHFMLPCIFIHYITYFLQLPVFFYIFCKKLLFPIGFIGFY